MDKETALLNFIDKMEQLTQFQDKIDISATIGQIWRGFVNEIKNHITIDVCAMFLVDEKTGEFKLENTEPENKSFICLKEIEYQIECDMFSWIIQRRKPAIIPSFVFKNQKSIIMLPLSTMKRTIGVVMAITPLEQSAITQENIRLVGMLAKQCALLMENSILYSNVREEHRALQEAQAQILQAEKMASIGRLTSGASHEILNPLNIISGHVQLLQLNEAENGHLSKPLGIIKSQTDRISNIINGMRQFASYVEFTKTRIDMGELLSRFVFARKSELAMRNIEISLSYDHKMPVIMGDPDKLQKVFQFLLSNSVDAMPEGGGVTIATTIENGTMLIDKPGNFLKIRFADTGYGIPEENMSRVFDPFFTTKNKDCRIGLGLSLAYGIVDNHGGIITVDALPDQGTIFYIYIPL